jgi:hypothetical protein
VEITGATDTIARVLSLLGSGNGSTRWVETVIPFTASGTSATVTFRDQSPVTASIDLLLDQVRIEKKDIVLPPGLAPLPTPCVTFSPVEAIISTFAPQAATYELPRSTDLVEWTAVEEIMLLDPGPLNFLDTLTTEPRIFYRIATKP